MKTRRPRRQQKQQSGGAPAALLGATAALLLLAGCYLYLLGGTAPPAAPGIGGPFELTAMDGRTVTERSFRGRYLLVYFGYTKCPDICPTTLGAVGDALDLLGAAAARVQPIFITVDPGRDTPEALRFYLAAFTPRLLGLTGTPRQIEQVEQQYRVSSVVHPDLSGAADYTVEHSSVLYLIGPDGRYLAPIRAGESGREMAADITRHFS